MIPDVVIRNRYAVGHACHTSPDAELTNTSTDRIGNQDHVDQRSGGDAPKLRARTLRRRHIGHAAQRPEDDVMVFPPT